MRLTVLFAAPLAATLATAACGRDVNATGPSTGFMTAEVHGLGFAARTITTTLRDSVLEVTGAEGPQRVVRIFVRGVGAGMTLPRTYPLAAHPGDSLAVTEYTSPFGGSTVNYTTSLSGSSGSVTITELTPLRIAGTFSAVTIRNGGTGAYTFIRIEDGAFAARF